MKLTSWQKNSLVSSHLDYCNAVYRGFAPFNLCKSQCIQNCLARVFTNRDRYVPVTSILRNLHWLPIDHYIFKTATLVYKSPIIWGILNILVHVHFCTPLPIIPVKICVTDCFFFIIIHVLYISDPYRGIYKVGYVFFFCLQ